MVRKVTANEVAIGDDDAACGDRDQPAAPHPRGLRPQRLLLAEAFTPDSAVAAGFLDEVVPADDLFAAAHRKATELSGLDVKGARRHQAACPRRNLGRDRRGDRSDDVEFREVIPSVAGG